MLRAAKQKYAPAVTFLTQKLLAACETVLALAFLAGCILSIAGAGSTFEPPGGLALIIILLLLAGTHRLRTGRWYDDL